MNITSIRINKYALLFSVAIALVFSSDPAHALLFDAARASFAADLANAGFPNTAVMDLLFGGVEVLLLVIPSAALVGTIANMNRGADAWMPWVITMVASLIAITFISVLVNLIFG